MSSKKKIITIVITTAALSISSVGFASAQGVGGHRDSFTKSITHGSGPEKSVGGKTPGEYLASVLAGLVTKGTITQVQADAIIKALADMRGAKDANHAADGATKDANRAAREALVSSTIGLDAATIKDRLKAGETLGAIAGAKKDALIAALVAFSTKNIDAAVTAGKMTAAQATAAKASMVAHVTEAVNSIRPAGERMNHKGKQMGKKGERKGHKSGAPVTP